MMNLTTKLTIAAAAFMAVAGTASAQTMEAKIPFAFRASGKVLAPGNYRVSVQTVPSASRLVIITSEDGKQETLAIAVANGAAQTFADRAALRFECGVSRCALTDVSTGAGGAAYRVLTPKLGKDETRTAEIAMTRLKVD